MWASHPAPADFVCVDNARISSTHGKIWLVGGYLDEVRLKIFAKNAATDSVWGGRLPHAFARNFNLPISHSGCRNSQQCADYCPTRHKRSWSKKTPGRGRSEKNCTDNLIDEATHRGRRQTNPSEFRRGNTQKGWITPVSDLSRTKL